MMTNERPDFSSIDLPNQKQRQVLAICYLECLNDIDKGMYRSGLRNGKGGQVDGFPFLQRRALQFYCEEFTRNRNAADFLLKPSKALSGIKLGHSTFWLPIECAKAEIEEAKRFKSINGNYSYMWPQKEVPQKNSLSHQEFIESLSELVGSGSNYFYGYEGSGPNGPEPIRSYLKPGMTGRGIMGVKGRFSDRVKYDGWYEDSRVRGRWAIQLKPFTTDLKKIYAEKFGENINSTGKAAEVLFSKAFGTEVIRWSDTGKAYLGEYYRQDSPGIQEVSKYLEKRYPHPKGEWTSLSIM